MHGGNGMPTNDGEQGCTILRIHGVGLTETHIIAPSKPRTDVRRREHLSDIPISNHLAHELHLRRSDRLSSHHCQYLLVICEPGQLQGFGQPVSQRPLAVDALAILQGRCHDFPMMRNLDRYDHDVNVWGSDECGRALVCAWQAKRRCGQLSARETSICDAYKLERIGQSA